jgi:hypothetical protein
LEKTICKDRLIKWLERRCYEVGLIANSDGALYYANRGTPKDVRGWDKKMYSHGRHRAYHEVLEAIKGDGY